MSPRTVSDTTMRCFALLWIGLALAYARFLDDWDSEETSIVSYGSDSEGNDLERRPCHCCPRGCWCHALVKRHFISITMMMDEADPSKDAQIVATIQIGRRFFSRKFDVNKKQEYCEKVWRKEFCFEFDVKDQTKEEKVPTCIKLTKPKEVDFGCVEIPLMATGSDVIDDESYDEENTSDLFFE